MPRRLAIRFFGGGQASIAAALFLLSLFVLPVRADDDVHGRLELQDLGAFAREDTLDASLGAEASNDMMVNLRLIWEPSWDRLSFGFDYVLDGNYGEGARIERVRGKLLPAPPPTWFNLTETFENHGLIDASQTIDRLFVGYTTPDFVIRVGRQALTWGEGLVFRPMDLFDPFSPTATDTEFKPGTDMVYTQWLFADGSDLQAIVVPRPAEWAALPSSNASSFALHFQTALSGIHTAWLLARDHGDWTAGAEASGPLGGATWDAEFVPTGLNNGPIRISALANFSDAVTLLDRNATIFAEYFHNGFGVIGPITFETLPPDLIDRLARGQLFNLRQNYLAAGLTLEWTPLLTLAPTIIENMDDKSAYAIASATYSLSDDLTLIAGAQAPLGPRGSEFGGIALSPATRITTSPPSQIYIQLRRYF